MKNIFNQIKNIFTYAEPIKYNFSLSPENNVEQKSNEISKNISSNYSENLDFIKDKYSILINSDIKIREFNFNVNSKNYNAFLFYIDGMINSESINHFVLRPLMLDNFKFQSSKKDTNKISIVKPIDTEKYIMDTLLPQNDVVKTTEFSQVFSQVNIGVSALFIENIDCAFLIDAKGFDTRSITAPENEFVVRGSQEAFIESIRTNTSLLRRLINNNNLVIESTNVGNISNTSCCICYMKNIANPDLVSEVKYRLNNLKIDSITSSGELEQLIQDSPIGLPQLISTERPDRTASYILDGRVAIIVNGTPYALIAPGVFTDFLTSIEDKNINYQFANLLKIIRFIALFITLTLPGFYIAVTTFHQEVIPTQLLFAIVSTRSSVPFPIILEILIMELSLELIRESGVRVPSALGQTIGIVGGLILGDAAVSANIVSPILIIIVALTGLTAFAVPDYSLGFHVRIARFLYLLAGYFAGFLGISILMFLHLSVFASIDSFGVSYLSPYAPISVNANSSYLLAPIWKRENRDNFLKPTKKQKESHVSMEWKFRR